MGSRNPYFAHLPTWHNRQDLAYALDNLPKLLGGDSTTHITLPLPPSSYPLPSFYSYIPAISLFHPLVNATAPPPSLAQQHHHHHHQYQQHYHHHHQYQQHHHHHHHQHNHRRINNVKSSSQCSSPTSSPMSGSIASPASLFSSPSASTPRTSPTNFKERFMVDMARENRRSRSSVSSSPSCSSGMSGIESSHDTYCHYSDASEYLPGDGSTASAFSHHSIPDELLMTPQESLQAGQPWRAATFHPRHPPSSTTSASSIPSTKPTKHIYPLQFSTRAKAMAFLFEVLRFLQKAPCGCDLVRGCACGQDGIEDHQGKQPCYICGEWFPERKDVHTGQNLGRSWHEQGSLRHHVSEARVKKWLDQVWRPPVTPATTPEQEAVGQFERQQQQQFYYQQALYAQRQQQQQKQQQQQVQIQIQRQPSPLPPPSQYGQQYRVAQQQLECESITASSPRHVVPCQVQQPRQEPQQQQQELAQRLWGMDDIEDEARTKSRSRSSSYSSMHSSSSSCTTGCSSMSSGGHGVPSMTPYSHSSAGMSTVSSLASSPCPTSLATPPLTIQTSGNATLAPAPERTKAVRSTSFPIPQEILDPSYRSPTFTIKRSSSSSSPVSSPTTSQPVVQQQQEQLVQPFMQQQQVSHPDAAVMQQQQQQQQQLHHAKLHNEQTTSPSSSSSSPLSSTASPIESSQASGSSRFNVGGKLRFSFTSDRFREAVEASKVAKLMLRRL